MTPLLIAGHGTADADGAAQFRQFVKRVAGRVEVPVAGGFIELSPPPLAEAVTELLHGNRERLVAVPLMLVAAGHAKGDIPAALARERARHPGLSTVYGRPLGPHPTVLSLLRERLASNAAMAGQNQFNELTYNQNIMVTVPGNTRFYLVLEKGTAAGGNSGPERTSSVAQASTRNSTPSLQDLRELLELKREMSQMYEQAGPATGATPEP